MSIIVADKNGKELGVLKFFREIEVDIGDLNDFIISLKTQNVDREYLWYESQIFIPGTEFGGIVKDIVSLTKSKTVKFMGDTWRGMLNKRVIEPPKGQDYLIVNGELNTILREMISACFGSWFVVPEEDTGINVKYQFERYVTLLDGLTAMLKTIQHRLSIKYIQGEPGESGYVMVCAVPVKNHSEESEYNQDSNINLTVRDYRRGINHLVCLGKGELKDRIRIDLYLQKDGSVGKTQYYKGLEERTAVYDYSSAEHDELEEGGVKRLKELADYKEFDMDIKEVDLELGDIVSGRDYVTGLYVERPVVQKILKMRSNTETIDYKLKGD